MKFKILMPNNRDFAQLRELNNEHIAAAGKMPAEQRWRKHLTLAPKVGSSLVAGALTNIIVAECTRRGVTISGDEGAAITTLLMFLAGYFAPHAQN